MGLFTTQNKILHFCNPPLCFLSPTSISDTPTSSVASSTLSTTRVANPTVTTSTTSNIGVSIYPTPHPKLPHHLAFFLYLPISALQLDYTTVKVVRNLISNEIPRNLIGHDSLSFTPPDQEVHLISKSSASASISINVSTLAFLWLHKWAQKIPDFLEDTIVVFTSLP